jgi:4'-phosphopantetheinyl transferase
VAERETGALRCQVWMVDPGRVPRRYAGLLDPTERGRRDRYLRDGDRARFAAAAVLLRLAAAAAAGTPPERVRVDRACDRCGQQHGRPRLPGTGLHASVSHAGDLVAVALCRAAPVGVDVEQVGDRDVAALVAACLADDEPLAGPADFYRYWCRKEAVVKATGEGLRAPLAQVRVSPADRPARLLSYRGAGLVAALRDLPVPAGYVGAVCVLHAGPLEVELPDPGQLLRST